ncbi:hypothetical protein [Endozoicomonas montiporae]|uniref:hypothetical protein n=1 Tax=Endozoicomonas montiporae TaxID=1027273 RepID=UPI000555E86B|nr:hypothetical protein [Endozoicomonas montiporae]
MNQTSGTSQYQYGSGLTCSVMASILFGITPWLVQQLFISDNYSSATTIHQRQPAVPGTNAHRQPACA